MPINHVCHLVGSQGSRSHPPLDRAKLLELERRLGQYHFTHALQPDNLFCCRSIRKGHGTHAPFPISTANLDNLVIVKNDGVATGRGIYLEYTSLELGSITNAPANTVAYTTRTSIEESKSVMPSSSKRRKRGQRVSALPNR